MHPGYDGRHLKGSDDLIEKSLMRSPKGGHGRTFCLPIQRLSAIVRDASFLESFVQIVQGDLPSFGQLVIDFALFVGQYMLEPVIGDVMEGERPGEIFPHGLHVPGHKLHGCNATRLDLVHELLNIWERSPFSPQAKALRIGQVHNFRGSGSGHIDHPSVGELVLKLNHGERRLRGVLASALSLDLQGIAGAVTIMHQQFICKIICGTSLYVMDDTSSFISVMILSVSIKTSSFVNLITLHPMDCKNAVFFSSRSCTFFVEWE